MAIHHFTFSDCIGILAGFCLFSLVAVAPGYTIGWLLDVVRFRERTLPFRLTLSVPLSIAIGPILADLLGRWLSLRAVWAAYGILSLYALFLLVRDLRKPGFSKAHLQVLGLVLAWMTIAVLFLADMQIHDRLYFPMASFDYAVRSAFVSAIGTFGLPAQNPFFFPGHPVVLRYHYYWLLLCALIHQMGGSLVDSRQALIAGTMWCGIGLICLVPLYLRLFSAKAAAGISRRTLIGISLLGVTGLDLLPTGVMLWMYAKGLTNVVTLSVERWNEQVDGWLYTMLWEPHYVASVIACLTGFLVLWDVPAGATRRHRAISGTAAGLAFATAVGSGVYVAFVFAIFLTLWMLITVMKKWYAETTVLALSGAVALALSIPFLRGLQSANSGGSFVQLTIRSFSLSDFLLALLNLNHPWQTLLGRLTFLPLNYFLELGLFFAAGLLVWKDFRSRKRAATRPELAAFTMAGTSIAVCSFLRSGVIQNNDLGWRGFLIAQFVLLIWAADLLAAKSEHSRSDRAILMILLSLGAAGVAYDLALLRFFPLLSDAGRVAKIRWLASDENLGKRTYANREAYEWLKARTSRTTIIQQNPNPPIQDTFYGLYADRQTVAADAGCGTVFGGDSAECVPVMQRLTTLYSAANTSGLRSFEAACKSLPIDVVIAKDTDAAWKDQSSWAWIQTPIFANDFVRLFTCIR